MAGLNDVVTQVEKEPKKKGTNRGWLCCCRKEKDSPPSSKQEQKGIDLQSRSSVPCILPKLLKCDKGKKCLVLDLDETLVHSSFKKIPSPDFVIEIELDGVRHPVFVRTRPGADMFLKAVAEKFEIVIFTASLGKYANPLLDILDPTRVVRHRLFREDCVQYEGHFVKDMTHLHRGLNNTIIVDNSPYSYLFQPDNAIPILSWFDDPTDLQLYNLLPFLDDLAECSNVVDLLRDKEWDFLSVDDPSIKDRYPDR